MQGGESEVPLETPAYTVFNGKGGVCKMIHEFRNPMPVRTPLGYGWMIYVRDGGTFSNDVFAIVQEHDGVIRHFKSDQFCVLENPTFDIENKKSEAKVNQE